MPALGTILSTTSVPTSAEFDDHSARHENGGADEITVAGLSGTLADPQTAAAHAAAHQDGGADEISIAGLAGTSVDLAAHLADTADAHDASAISFTPNGSIAATDVQAAIQEVRDEATAGVTDADYLVGTAHAGLSAEIVVGATPGGELGGTWASPTVDATHSGSAHHDPVTVGTGLDVTGQLVELDLSEVAAGGELAGFMDAPTVDATHSGSTHASLANVYVQDADPGAVGEGKLWIDTTIDDPFVYRRNAADDGWVDLLEFYKGLGPIELISTDADFRLHRNDDVIVVAEVRSDGARVNTIARYADGTEAATTEVGVDGFGGTASDDLGVMRVNYLGQAGLSGDADAEVEWAIYDDAAALKARLTLNETGIHVEGDVDAGGFTIKNLAEGADPADAATVSQFLSLGLGVVLAIDNDANGLAIINLADPTDPQDAATRAYVLANAGAADTVSNILAAGLFG